MKENITIIILAAGLGTRMKSDMAKVLHEINGRPMIQYVVETSISIAGQNVIVVIGHQAELVEKTVNRFAKVSFALQDRQLGTGHAVMCALPFLPEQAEKIIILCGDVPLLSADTINNLVEKHEADNNDVTVLAVEPDDPHGYGRIITDSTGNILKIVEEADATETEKAIKTINSGIYCVSRDCLKQTLEKITADNTQNEYYLTDIIEIGKMNDMKIGVLVSNNTDEVIGVNSIKDLEDVEAILLGNQSKTS